MTVPLDKESTRRVQVLGIDAGGTMTDTFFVDSEGDFVVGKAQSTPQNEALGLIASAREGLEHWGLSPRRRSPGSRPGSIPAPPCSTGWCSARACAAG